jgi:hypothetical protein
LNVLEDEGIGRSVGFDVPHPGMTYWLEKAEAEMRELE